MQLDSCYRKKIGIGRKRKDKKIMRKVTHKSHQEWKLEHTNETIIVH